jgi:hypothetical protein
MAKKPEPPKPVRWGIYKLAAKQTWVGEVEASDEAEAIEKTATEFRHPRPDSAARMGTIAVCGVIKTSITVSFIRFFKLWQAGRRVEPCRVRGGAVMRGLTERQRSASCYLI